MSGRLALCPHCGAEHRKRLFNDCRATPHTLESDLLDAGPDVEAPEPKSRSDLNFGYNNRVQRVITDFELFFDEIDYTTTTVKMLKQFIINEPIVHLATRQVPSGLAVRQAAKSTLVNKNVTGELIDRGFKIFRKDGDEEEAKLVRLATRTDGSTRSIGSSSISTLRALLMEARRESYEPSTVDSHDTEFESDSDRDEPEEEEFFYRPDDQGYGRIRKSLFQRGTKLILEYEDPWKIQATLYYRSLEGGKAPEVAIWYGDVVTIDGLIPGSSMHPSWGGSKRNKIRFHEIKDPREQISFLRQRTHWGAMLWKSANDGFEDIPKSFFTSLKGRLKAFLHGKPDPAWGKGVGTYYRDTSPRSGPGRSKRLLELLKTVTGMHTQRYLCFPNEKWTWSKFDLFILANLSYLIGDEFLDGDLQDEIIHTKTRFSELKKLRKTFKKRAHDMDRSGFLADLSGQPRWLRQFFRPMLRILQMPKDSEDDMAAYLQKVSVMSQTRGCGTPPSLVVLQSKVDFLETVSTEPEPLTFTEKVLIRESVRMAINDMPPGIFTGLQTKFRVTVTGAASFEHTRMEGGTVHTVNDFVKRSLNRGSVLIYDLDTGQHDGSRLIEDCTVGELTFWSAMEELRKYDWDELREVFVTVVREPGKARTVTKGRAALKIVLDMISKACSAPLKKVESSKSGMAEANHAWNFQFEFYKKLNRGLVFGLEETLEKTGETLQADYKISDEEGVTFETYRPLYAGSTDYKNATDAMNHEVAAHLGETWMRECGIPAFLRYIVREVAFKPRTVYFTGRGLMAQYGEASPTDENEFRRKVTLVKGVLMGDPLTKAVLHLLNISVRRLAKAIRNRELQASLPGLNRFQSSIEVAMAFRSHDQ